MLDPGNVFDRVDFFPDVFWSEMLHLFFEYGCAHKLSGNEFLH